jgi:4-amino-4-deoxy-L-arabinose transferase-like glycosyltransferase
VAALVGAGVVGCWQRRRQRSARLVGAGVLAVSAVWSWVLLGRTPGFVAPLRWVVLGAGVLAAAGLAAGVRPRVLGAVAGVAALAGPLAYCIQTVTTAHHGGIVNAGPALPGAQPGGGHRHWMEPPNPSAQMTAMLTGDAGEFTWVAATQGGNQAAGYQLATGEPVMAVGGFAGRDPAPTLAQFRTDVSAGRIHYFIDSRRPDDEESEPNEPNGSGDSEAARITAWVKDGFPVQQVDGVEVYDLTGRVRQ